MLSFTDYQDLFFSCRLCFTKLKLLLLAIEVQNESGDGKKIAVNPKETKLQKNTLGFFVAPNAEDVKRYSLKKK